MAGKSSGYLMGAIEMVAGLALTAVGLGAIGVPLYLAGLGTIAGTALSPSPPRVKTLRDSPTYGIDKFDNPRGSEALIPVIYGEHRTKPVVIAEAVREAVEGASGGANNTLSQQFRWIGVVAEGKLASVSEIRINDRDVVSDLQTDVQIGKGNGSKREFTFPTKWVFIGDDEDPAVLVKVDGVVKSWQTSTVTAEFVMPADKSKKTFDIVRDDKGDRILGDTVTMTISGTGTPAAAQPKRSGTYRWGTQKLARHKLRVKFKTRPPAGYTVRVTYDVLTAAGFTLVQDADGETKAVFGTAPTNGAVIKATYRTARIRNLRVSWRPGTLDQQPMEGFTDLEQTRNPTAAALAKDTPATYATGGREVDDLRIGIVAPRGFIQYDDEGGSGGVQARVRIEYRVTGASKFTVLRGPSGDYFTLRAQKSSAARWEIGIRDELEARALSGDTWAIAELAAFERAAFDLQVTRITKPNTDSRVIDELEFGYVTEVLREGFCYPGSALLGLRGKTGPTISGSSLRVSCLALRADLYDPRAAGGDRDIGSPFNPALALRDLITSSEGEASERFGGGFYFAGSDLWGGDDPATLNGLAAWADFCDEYVHRPGDDATQAASATNGERRCRLSVVLDTPQSLSETIGDIAFLGYCFATLQGATWRFPLDQDGDSVFTFVDDVEPAEQNCFDVVLRIDEWKKTPTGIRGSFWSELLDYERDELFYPVDSLPEGTPLNIREVDLRGCTREYEAARILRHLAEQARSMPYPINWSAHPGVQHVEAGDIVTIQTRVPYSTGASSFELQVRVLACMVSRDDDGKVAVKYAGRVMSSSTYALRAISVPARTPKRAEPLVRAGRKRRLVTGLTARIAG